MLTKENILEVLRAEKPFLTQQLGVKNIGLFGSYARGEQQDDSDVDLLIEMPADYDNLYQAFIRLEKKIPVKIDLVRKGSHLSKQFLQFIGKDLIYV